MAKTYRDFYVGSGLEMDFYRPSREITERLKYVVALSPFIAKKYHTMELQTRSSTPSGQGYFIKR